MQQVHQIRLLVMITAQGLYGSVQITGFGMFDSLVLGV